MTMILMQMDTRKVIDYIYQVYSAYASLNHKTSYDCIAIVANRTTCNDGLRGMRECLIGVCTKKYKEK